MSIKCNHCGTTDPKAVHAGTGKCWDVDRCTARYEAAHAERLESALRQCVEALEATASARKGDWQRGQGWEAKYNSALAAAR